MPFASDRERKLVFVHENYDCFFFVIDFYPVEFGRTERVLDIGGDIVVVSNDVDLFAFEFTDDIFHPRSAHANTSPHTIDLGVV